MQHLQLPKNQIIFLQIRLKGLYPDEDYVEATKKLLDYLDATFKPKTILTPTFTYSFTKTGIYDRVNTPSEVGRFGEEVRKILGHELRTMNPVFSVMDTHGYLKKFNINENTAFGKGSLLDVIEPEGYISLNINLEEMVIVPYHVMEEKYRVDYRYIKHFNGNVSADGVHFKPVNFAYFVRDLALDTTWRRAKIKNDLAKAGLLRIEQLEQCECNWIHSADLDFFISKKLRDNIRYMITD